MNKQMLLTMFVVFAVIFSVSAVSASDVNVTDSYATSLVDDTSDVSVPLENAADSSDISVSSYSNVDNDSSKGSLSSEEVLGSENSNTLSTNIDDNSSYSSNNGVTIVSVSSLGADIVGDVSSSFDVSKSITAKDYTKYYKGSTKYTATFLDGQGNALSKTKVKITVNGKTYTKTTNANGVASLAISLKPGTYKVTSSNPVTGYNLTTNFKILSTIKASNIKKIYTDSRKFTATFYKSDGSVLAKKYIKFKINGKTYSRKTNAKGVASLSLVSLAKGTYEIVSYNTDGLTKTNTVKVVRTSTSKLIVSDYTFIPKNKKVIKVTLHNQYNYAPGPGKTIRFTVNGVNYYRTTDSNGVASVKLPSLDNGVYTVKYYFAGNDFYKASSANSKLTIIPTHTPTYTVKSTTTFGSGANTLFKVALTSGSVPLAGRVVTLKVDGSTTYSKTTDQNGIVSLPIDLAIGKHTISYSNPALNGVKAKSGSVEIVVKERTTSSLTWKSGTSFNGGSQTYNVLLSDASGKALSGKTVKLTVNSKTYSATTASNGYATFTATLNSAGTYAVSYSFAGDNGYKSSSGSTKISVTKPAQSLNGFGYWVFGSDMKSVNLNTLANAGTTDIFLNYYAIEKFGKSTVQSWIASANKVGIRVHIWMQIFYDGSWVNPVKNGSPNTAYFNQKIDEALTYAKISGVSGIHFDYLRYPGTAYKTSGGTAAINQFVKTAVSKIHAANSNIIVSAAIMPETTDNEYYYGQDISALSQYLDVIIPMIYKGNYEASSSWITTTTKWFVSHSKGAKIWSGLQSYVSDDDVTQLSASALNTDVKNAVKGGAAGVILFRYGLSYNQNFKNLGVVSATSSTTTDSSSSSSSSTSSSTTDSSSSSSSSTSSSTAPKTISINDILEGAATVKAYYEKNSKIPSSVTAAGYKFTVPEFLYLMAQATYQLGSSNTNAITCIYGVKDPESPFGDNIYSEELYKSDYLTVAKNLANYIKTNKQAPNYCSSTVGNIIYSEAVDAFSRILTFYKNNDKYMPNYCVIKYGSSSDSSASTSAGGLNVKNTISDLSAYLKATSNCQVTNSAIKNKAAALTSGLTTVKEKAIAIFNYVRDQVSYSFYYDTAYGATGTLSRGYGNCVDQAHLVVALARAAGIPARYEHGTCVFTSGSTYGHVWAQILVDNVWVVADPTSSRNSFGVVNNWYTSSYSHHAYYASLPF